jgi:hypothetical protein
MATIEIIAYIWAFIMSFYGVIGKVTGVNALGILLIKLFSFITMIYFGWKLILMLP